MKTFRKIIIPFLLMLVLLSGCSKNTESETATPAERYVKIKDNIYFDEDGMEMSISKGADGKYKGAEIRTITGQGSFSNGYFGGTFKPSNVKGTVSTFFLYTGPAEGNPHDEIDIEFLGKDTTKVQFNYYGGSDKSHEYMYELGFDASQAFHQYGFYWDMQRIVWFVDNQPVYQANTDIPTHQMK